MQPSTLPPAPPMHGFRGDRSDAGFVARPGGLTLAVSREAGARGTTIARRVAEQLGWQVFDQEMLDFLMVDEPGRGQLLADVPEGARLWVNSYLGKLQREKRLGADPETLELVRVLLAVAARGDAVIVGRGAGFLLPAESTVHVRVFAPFESRVNFFVHTLRMTREEAAGEVRSRDERRAKFLARSMARDPADPLAFDATVNSTRLGVEGAAQLIGWAVRTKQMFAELASPGEPGA